MTLFKTKIVCGTVKPVNPVPAAGQIWTLNEAVILLYTTSQGILSCLRVDLTNPVELRYKPEELRTGGNFIAHYCTIVIGS